MVCVCVCCMQNVDGHLHIQYMYIHDTHTNTLIDSLTQYGTHIWYIGTSGLNTQCKGSKHAMQVV
jgi:hypothetical protein